MIEGVPAAAVYVLAFVEMLKKLPVFDSDKARRWLPLLAVVLGVIFSVLFEGEFSRSVVLDGVLCGLMAGGTFCAFKQLESKVGVRSSRYVQNYNDER